MPRRSYPSPSLAAAVRIHFALTQTELARFVGVSRALLANVEAGRRELAEGPRHRLWVLARYLPAPDGQGPAAPPFAVGTDADAPNAPADALPGTLDVGIVQERLRHCRFRVAQIRYELDQRTQPAQEHARRRWALGILREALAGTAPPVPGQRLAYLGATPNPTADLYWLDRLGLRTTTQPVPLTPTVRALQLARLRGLEAEIAALTASLPG